MEILEQLPVQRLRQHQIRFRLVIRVFGNTSMTVPSVRPQQKKHGKSGK